MVISAEKLRVSQSYHCKCATVCKSEKNNFCFKTCLITLNNEVTFHLFKLFKQGVKISFNYTAVFNMQCSEFLALTSKWDFMMT